MPARAPSPDRRAARRRPSALALAGVAAALGGCGSAAVADLPAPAVPGVSPPQAHAPTGGVVRLGPRGSSAAPTGLAVDPDTGRVAVGLASPPALVLVDGATGRPRARVPLPAPPGQLSAAGGDVLVPAGEHVLRVRARDGRVVQDTAVAQRARTVLAGGPGTAFAAGEALGSGDGALVALSAGGRRRAARVDASPTTVARVDAGRVAVVSGRARRAALLDATTLRELAGAPAGVGPTRAVARGDYLWVVDTRGEALLVFRTRPTFSLVRRLSLPGGPFAIALDKGRYRLWVTLTGTNEIAEFPSHGRPHELRRLPTVRQPDAIAVDPITHRLFVGGAGGALELIDPPPLP
jgi:DNA-binding beta-propeller fold protein YncE